MVILFWISITLIFWAMIGYPIFLYILSFIIKRENKKDYTFLPSVTVMVVAHNEEKVILEKLENLVELDYPKEKLEILITSDNSTDKTNSITNTFIENHKSFNIKLYEAKERKGKTNAQNEAQKFINSEILVMTDANAMLEKNSIKELVSSFSEEDISYVCGRLDYINHEDNLTANSESQYWNLDLKMRDIESNIQTITAGNGALYAIRNERYYDFNPIESHDSSMPIYYALRKERAIFNPKAIAKEKAGEVIQDEFQRKVRMNRIIINGILPNISILNFFKYKWFAVFYFGHRTTRYLLWVNHLLIYISNLFLIKTNNFYLMN